jgi:hypothetical protein
MINQSLKGRFLWVSYLNNKHFKHQSVFFLLLDGRANAFIQLLYKLLDDVKERLGLDPNLFTYFKCFNWTINIIIWSINIVV